MKHAREMTWVQHEHVKRNSYTGIWHLVGQIAIAKNTVRLHRTEADMRTRVCACVQRQQKTIEFRKNAKQ